MAETFTETFENDTNAGGDNLTIEWAGSVATETATLSGVKALYR